MRFGLKLPVGGLKVQKQQFEAMLERYELFRCSDGDHYKSIRK